jgi:predicted heme/steroid binding protein
MVVPLAAEPGTTSALTVSDVSTSYVWGGGPSSAQYYVNNAGVEHSSASSLRVVEGQAFIASALQ